MTHHQVLIVGCGTAGLAVAKRLVIESPGLDVAIIEPAETQEIQRLWTMVGSGVVRPEHAQRDRAPTIPDGVIWIHDSVKTLNPGGNSVVTASGENISYDYLVAAPGVQTNWNEVAGLRDSVGKDGVCSIYSHETATATWEVIRNFQQGVALFTQPAGMLKCMTCSQQMCYLADEEFRRRGVRDQTRMIFISGESQLFPIQQYCGLLEKVMVEKGIEAHFRTELIEIRPETKEAVFRNVDSGEVSTLRFDMLHVPPPMGPLDIFANSLLADQNGWIDVDRHTLQHVRFPNVFGIGDAANLPTIRSEAASEHQAPVLVSNLVALMERRPLTAKYDGFTGRPIVTGYGQLLRADFDYGKLPCAGSVVELRNLTQPPKPSEKPAD
jgi:sulfide:quinone oxidoreductase